MDFLHVKGHQIVDPQDQPVMLHGTCFGGWMNMEEFINCKPHAALVEVLKVRLSE